MPERDPRRLAAGALVALILVLLAAWYLAHSRPTAAASAGAPVPTISLERQSGGRVVVDVAGAVHRPGVYRLSGGTRVEDALQRAGGATRRADLSQINRAAKLEDGRQILVPVRAPAAPAGAPSAPAATTAAPAAPRDPDSATPQQPDAPHRGGPAPTP